MTTRTVTAKRVQEWQDDNHDLQVIDVLPEGTFEDEHIPGAHNIPLGDAEFETRVKEFAGQPDSETKVVVYCANTQCDLSPRAAKKIDAMGYRDVFDLEGGLEEWKQEGYSTAHGGT